MPNQFSDFYNSLDADSAKRGKQFEHFVKWFLKADPEWATQVDQIWLWEEWPERWGAGARIAASIWCSATRTAKTGLCRPSAIRPTTTSPNTMSINSSANRTGQASNTAC